MQHEHTNEQCILGAQPKYVSKHGMQQHAMMDLN